LALGGPSSVPKTAHWGAGTGTPPSLAFQDRTTRPRLAQAPPFVSLFTPRWSENQGTLPRQATPARE
jgi:hypothetical protein